MITFNAILMGGLTIIPTSVKKMMIVILLCSEKKNTEGKSKAVLQL